MKKILSTLLLLTTINGLNANSDSIFVRKIYDLALTKSECYFTLKDLCKNIGHRISGSIQAEQAVQWGKKYMETLQLDKVFLQEVMVPHWVRGDKQICHTSITKAPSKSGTRSINKQFKITALGGSVGTNGPITAEVILVNTLEELETLGKEKITGKIVLFNRPFDPKPIHTFKSYGGCVDQRVDGASDAGKYGAVAVLVRSMTHSKDDHPHTGSLRYDTIGVKIPAAAISTNDADFITNEISKGVTMKITLDMNCETLPDVKSYNVVGEIKGKEFPNEIITVGGHLDSWDIGEGAHDDGAGCVQSMEVLHLIKLLNYQPRHTIRAVLFMNEENGLRGGKKYAELAEKNQEKHIAAIESDRGGFAPRGFAIEGKEDYLTWMKSYTNMLKPYDLHYFEQGGSGADISPLKKKFTEILLIGFVPDSQRYFDHHHAETDVFEAVNKRELELGAAAMATLVYLMDTHLFNQAKK